MPATLLPHCRHCHLLLLGQLEHLVGAYSMNAEELVFPCRCPLAHPYFHERLRELMQLPEPAPMAQRKHVLYMSRNEDAIGNAGRKVRRVRCGTS